MAFPPLAGAGAGLHFSVLNIDTIIFAEAPKLSPYRSAMQQNISSAIDLEPDKLQTYYKALQLKPQDPIWCRQLAEAYVRANKLVNAVIFYRILLNINPDDSEAHQNLGRILERQNNLSAAIKHYQIAVKLSPEKTEYANTLEKAQGKLEIIDN